MNLLARGDYWKYVKKNWLRPPRKNETIGLGFPSLFEYWENQVFVSNIEQYFSLRDSLTINSVQDSHDNSTQDSDHKTIHPINLSAFIIRETFFCREKIPGRCKSCAVDKWTSFDLSISDANDSVVLFSSSLEFLLMIVVRDKLIIDAEEWTARTKLELEENYDLISSDDLLRSQSSAVVTSCYNYGQFRVWFFGNFSRQVTEQWQLETRTLTHASTSTIE